VISSKVTTIYTSMEMMKAMKRFQRWAQVVVTGQLLA
jgi:hypothetical protein